MIANTYNPSTWEANQWAKKFRTTLGFMGETLSLCMHTLSPNLRYIRVRISRAPHYFVLL